MATKFTITVDADDDFTGLTLSELERFVRDARSADIGDGSLLDVEFRIIPADEAEGRYREVKRLTSLTISREG